MHELEICIVFTPQQPKLFRLNTHAWLVLALCSGQPHDALKADYLEAVVPPLTQPVALRQLQECLDMLERSGIIEQAYGAAPTQEG